jgi:hypothetical protein
MKKFTTDATTVQALIYSALFDFARILRANHNPDAMGRLNGFAQLRGLPVFETVTDSWCDRINAMQVAEPAPEWDGEGLPPVGTICETRTRNGGEWEVCKIHFIGKKTGMLSLEGVDELWFQMDCRDFRVYRTPERIAAEERAVGINEIYSLPGSLLSYKAAEMIYDAGYRKQVAE